jgi:uncharacterized protein (TIGR03437 family)
LGGEPLTVAVGSESTISTSAREIVAGVIQIDIKIPAGVQTGNIVPVVIKVGNTSSQAGVTIAVR